ncbi:biotin--[acetyl-CoA-carboxylase] ligase [Phyllobacterium salinisoli]|uniref:biotin--[biotin carboxyl-carrier protein] ligase n=1 Tax=Phyllobacterium salinisoli TaxID=1899321 RepID=A0A368JYJ8_9HYPH|nr:biotin--[acetyl-CoA-carboxylase] ligase [Phyllobacterium salinisoli]RCS21974.1 biotin--[acetyl-CoA-carboxylase] ligase [Phyllobacterium salinisoli]
MAFSLSPLAGLSSYRLEAFDSVGSTNAVALERAHAGDPGKLWVVSKRQESGRGRRGRAWATPAGNLAATLLLVESYELKTAATLGFVAGLSLADALDAVFAQTPSLGSARIGLKWPNDVLVDGAKLSGILLESALLPDGRFGIAIGIGVNVVSHPEDLPYPATSLQALGSACDAETLFLALSDSWRENCALWNEGRGLEAIRARWLERAAGLGGEVAVRMGGRVISGIFETIDEDCQFVIRDEDGARVRITAGDVHFGAVASAKAV